MGSRCEITLVNALRIQDKAFYIKHIMTLLRPAAVLPTLGFILLISIVLQSSFLFPLF